MTVNVDEADKIKKHKRQRSCLIKVPTKCACEALTKMYGNKFPAIILNLRNRKVHAYLAILFKCKYLQIWTHNEQPCYARSEDLTEIDLICD